MMQSTHPLLVMFMITSSCVKTSPVDNKQETLVSSLCPNVSDSMLQAGVDYGAAAHSYGLTTSAAMEPTSTQVLILSLLNCLVTEDVTSCTILAECSHHIQQLRSRHLRLWLREDFRFPDKEMKKAMTQLDALVANGTLNLPSHVLTIMSSLADVYQITLQSKENSEDLMLQLENAVANNSPCEIITLATKGGNVNGLTQSGDSLVHLAIKTGSRSSIAVLGFLKADLEVLNAASATPMEEAIKNNSHSSIKELILAGANIEKRFFKGNTYLHIAATTFQNEALQVLLDEGLEPNKKNYLGETSLLLAVRAGNVQGVEMLLQRGANVSLVSESGKSLYQMAIDSNNPDMFKALTNFGCLQNLDLGNDDTLVHLIVRLGNATEMLKVLKGRRMPVNTWNKDGFGPLHIITDPSVARILVRIGADVNFRTKNGKTALHIASSGGSLEMVRTLVQLGAEVDIQDDEGNTALMTAAQQNNSNIVTSLLYSGADPTLKNKEDQTALHLAAQGDCVECVTILLDAGANVDEKNIHGITPALAAAVDNHLDVLQLLLEHGADPESQSNNGWTPLTLASANGQLEVVKLLIDKGASLNFPTALGITALSEAIKYDQKDVEDYLRSIGGVE